MERGREETKKERGGLQTPQALSFPNQATGMTFALTSAHVQPNEFSIVTTCFPKSFDCFAFDLPWLDPIWNLHSRNPLPLGSTATDLALAAAGETSWGTAGVQGPHLYPE